MLKNPLNNKTIIRDRNRDKALFKYLKEYTVHLNKLFCKKNY